MAGWVPRTLAVSNFLFMPPTSSGEWPVNSVKNWEDTWLNLERTGIQYSHHKLSLFKTYLPKVPQALMPFHYNVPVTFALH